MLQFYFLSILLNLVCGLVLVDATDLTQKESFKTIQKGTVEKSNVQKDDDIPFFDNPTFRLVLGLLTVFTGIMKLLSVVHTDIPVVGDLLPALAGIAGGVALLIEYYQISSTTSVSLPDVLRKVFVGGRKYVGIFCIVAGLLHFLFPSVLFL